MNIPRLSRGAIIGISLGVIAVVTAFVLFLVNNSVTNTGNVKEAGLNAQYLDNQNELSACTTKIRETANIAGAQADKFEEVMVEVIKGRYEGREGNPGTMFSAIVEQYPDLASLSSAYERVHNVVVGCRSDYKNIQTKLLDMLQKYDSWRTGSFTVRTFGGEYPSNNLVAQIGTDRTRKGQVALDQMYTIVVTKDTVDAYKTGELVPEQPFPAVTSTK